MSLRNPARLFLVHVAARYLSVACKNVDGDATAMSLSPQTMRQIRQKHKVCEPIQLFVHCTAAKLCVIQFKINYGPIADDTGLYVASEVKCARQTCHRLWKCKDAYFHLDESAPLSDELLSFLLTWYWGSLIFLCIINLTGLQQLEFSLTLTFITVRIVPLEIKFIQESVIFLQFTKIYSFKHRDYCVP